MIRTRDICLAIVVTVALSGCSSQQSGQPGTTRTARIVATTTLPGTASTTTRPPATTVPRLVAAAVPTGCRGNFYGADVYNPPSQLIECPDGGPVGTVVTLTGAGCTFPGREVLLKFFGPTEYQGSGGAGVWIVTSANGVGRFRVQFTVPRTVPKGGSGDHRPVAVVPGPTWFASQPSMAGCLVKFVVAASLART